MTMGAKVKPGVLVLIGVLAGVFVGLAGGWLLVNALEKTVAAEPLPALPSYDIEVVVEESYVNRMMLGSNSALIGGSVDLQPGGVATFVVQLAAGPFKPVVHGEVAFRAADGGRMAVSLLRVKMGRLSLLRLVPGSMMEDINALVNDQLVGRVGSKGLEVVAVATDDTSLRLYLAQRE